MTQAHLLRESYRLIRALPCLKNNRERLPVTKLLDNPKGFCFNKEKIIYEYHRHSIMC